ncbi:MAG: EVE domain-containing protein [Planctomycetota bacterium]|jgi:predicted RNA-binding protein with PUA-like domain|nr:EVE domain-containing protein [Planctomycetota bacterium]
MAYWLVKEEPTKYTFEMFLKDGTTCWDGVRNYQARNNLRLMSEGDKVVFYHSGKLKSSMGTAVVVKEGYPDPTAKEGDWTAVDLQVVEAFDPPVSLAQVRADKVLAECALVKQTRLSVMPLTKPQFDKMRKLGGLK